MNDCQQWRKQQRVKLIARRAAISKRDHYLWSTAITLLLQQGFSDFENNVVGSYLPIHDEYDPRPIMYYLEKQGVTLAVPEVTKKNSPLCFKRWWPDAPMKKGTYGIPVPINTEHVAIHCALVPMVGFDQQGYRLGYGGGYYDRTLVSVSPPPLSIGIAFEMFRLDNVYPQRHDVPMDFIITEAGIHQNIDKKLIPISTKECVANNKLNK